MSDNWAVFVDGLASLADFDATRDQIRLAASRAINKVTRDGRAMFAKDVRDVVNLPASYVSPSGKRMYVSELASPGSLEGKITVGSRATSLARYVTSPNKDGSTGVRVEVKPGRSRTIKRAFLIKLPAGAGVDTKYNMGLAIRLRKGEKLERKYSARMLSKGLYVLYGPSVQQVFRANDGDGLASDRAPLLLDQLEREFLRLMEL